MKPLILLPGALGYKSQFEPLQQELNALNISTLAVDLAGHGNLPYQTDANSVPEMAEAFMNQLDLLKIDGPINVFGHSLGGYIGLYLCLNFPERINRLFTLGTKWQWSPEIAAKETSMLNPDIMEQKIPDYVAHLKSVHSADWKTVVKSIAQLMNDLGENSYLSPENLETIGQVVRIGIGDRDTILSLEESQNTFRALKNGQLQVFPQTKHPYEKVDIKVLSQAISSFFK